MKRKEERKRKEKENPAQNPNPVGQLASSPTRPTPSFPSPARSPLPSPPGPAPAPWPSWLSPPAPSVARAARSLGLPHGPTRQPALRRRDSALARDPLPVSLTSRAHLAGSSSPRDGPPRSPAKPPGIPFPNRPPSLAPPFKHACGTSCTSPFRSLRHQP